MVVKDGRFGAYVTDGELNATLRRDDERGHHPRARRGAAGREAGQGPAKKRPQEGDARKPPRATARPRQEGAGEEGREEGRRAKPLAAPADRWPATTEPDAHRPERRRPRRVALKRASDSQVRVDSACRQPDAKARVTAGRSRHGRRQADQEQAGKAAPAPSAGRPAGGGPGARPAPGQRLYDMPFSAAAPRLINPELGLHNLVARAGHNAAYEIDVTLLDAPDHRLIRSGVLLAHRVLDGRGEWFLTAPDWQPLLPKDRIELMGHADLPEELADLIRPLRRRATLGPVAALNCDRREFALRDDAAPRWRCSATTRSPCAAAA